MLTRSSSNASSRRIQKRRRLAFSAGVATMLATAAAAVALGSGCIFDEGDYDGGGRRTGSPTSTETAPSVPTSTGTTSPTSSTTTNPPVDSGAPDVDTLDN